MEGRREKKKRYLFRRLRRPPRGWCWRREGGSAGPRPLTCPRRPRPPRRGCRLFALGLSGAEIPFRFCE